MKSVVVCIPMDTATQDSIVKRLARMDWLKEARVSFVHVFKEETYPYMVPPTLYPTSDQKKEIENTILQIFENLEKNFNAAEKKAECIFHPNPKEGMVEYIKSHQPDIVVTYTKEKRGIKDYFHSSFTEYLIKHAPCDVMAIR